LPGSKILNWLKGACKNVPTIRPTTPSLSLRMLESICEVGPFTPLLQANLGGLASSRFSSPASEPQRLWIYWNPLTPVQLMAPRPHYKAFVTSFVKRSLSEPTSLRSQVHSATRSIRSWNQTFVLLVISQCLVRSLLLKWRWVSSPDKMDGLWSWVQKSQAHYIQFDPTAFDSLSLRCQLWWQKSLIFDSPYDPSWTTSSLLAAYISLLPPCLSNCFPFFVRNRRTEKTKKNRFPESQITNRGR